MTAWRNDLSHFRLLTAGTQGGLRAYIRQSDACSFKAFKACRDGSGP